MANLNKVQLIGRITKDIDLKYTQSQKAVCNLSIATNEKRKDQDGNVQETSEFHSVVCWDKQAELAGKYLSKGREVYIEGKLTTRKWEDQNGQPRYTTEIVCREMQFIGSNNQGQQSTNSQQGQMQQGQGQQQGQQQDHFANHQQRQANAGVSNQHQANAGFGGQQDNGAGFAGPNNNHQMQQNQGQQQNNFSDMPNF